MNKQILTVAVAVMLAGGCCVPRQDESITLGTFNLRCPADKTPPFDWKTRIPLICEVLHRSGAKIVGVQEPVDFQLQPILKKSGFKYVGGARNDFRKSGEYSCILYDPERFEVLESGTFGLSEKPDVPGVRSWNSACPRIATWGVFRDRRNGKKFIMYNTHLDHKSELARINGIKLIVEHAKTQRKLGLPMILTGDFNARPDSETVKTAQSLLSDSATVSETEHRGEIGTFHKWGTLPERRRIDYIFVSPEVRVLEHGTLDCRVNGVYASDHDPVIVRIVLK